MSFARTIAEQLLALGTTVASLALVSAPAPGQVAPLRSPGTGLETFVVDRWLWNPAWTYYRSREEEQEWREKRDPLKLLAEKLVAENLTDQSVLDRIQADVKSEVEKGMQFAIDAPYPNVDEVDQHVYE